MWSFSIHLMKTDRAGSQDWENFQAKLAIDENCSILLQVATGSNYYKWEDDLQKQNSETAITLLHKKIK